MATPHAATLVYGCGRRAWPTLQVGRRIVTVEQFTFLLGERRDEVVRLLMWEIAIVLLDGAKTLDRTLRYIRNTIDALKDLDRAS